MVFLKGEYFISKLHLARLSIEGFDDSLFVGV